MADEIKADDDGKIAVADAPAPEKSTEADSLYGPADVQADEPDGMVKVREDEPGDTKDDAEPEEEQRLLSNKYKTPEELEKAYDELNKKFRRGDSKPVDLDNYKNEKLEEFGLPDDDPLLSGWNALATEEGVSKDFYDKAIGMFIEAIGAQDVQVKQARAEIMEELGPNAEAIVQDMGQWAQGYVQSGVWDEENYAWFLTAADSAAGTRALLKIRESYADRIPFKAAVPAGGEKITKGQLEQLMNEHNAEGNFRYHVDKQFRAEVDQKAAASFN